MRSRSFVYIALALLLATAQSARAFPGTGRVYKPAAPVTVNLVISANTNNYNVFTAAGSPAGVATVTLTINAGVTVSSTSTASAAIDTGAFTGGSTLSIINNGSILGAGGAGRVGATSNTANAGAAGFAGGPALNVQLPVTISNSGQIFGGGGGGGSGGA
jgi:hypothetical protein